MTPTDPSVSLPMRAAGICAEELLDALDTTHGVGMPLSAYTIKRTADKVADAAITHDGPAQRRALLILAATALLMIASRDEAIGSRVWPTGENDD